MKTERFGYFRDVLESEIICEEVMHLIKNKVVNCFYNLVFGICLHFQTFWSKWSNKNIYFLKKV